MVRNNLSAFVFHIAASITAIICIVLLGELFSHYNTTAVLAVTVFGVIIYLLYILFGYLVLRKQKSWVKDLLSLISVVIFCLIIWAISLTPVRKHSDSEFFVYETDMSVFIVSANIGLSAPLMLFEDLDINIDIDTEKYLVTLLSLLPYMSLFLGLRLKDNKFMNRLFKRKGQRQRIIS